MHEPGLGVEQLEDLAELPATQQLALDEGEGDVVLVLVARAPLPEPRPALVELVEEGVIEEAPVSGLAPLEFAQVEGLLFELVDRGEVDVADFEGVILRELLGVLEAG